MRVDRAGLRVVRQRAAAPSEPVPDALVYQEQCIEAYLSSQRARGFSANSIRTGAGTLRRFLALAGRPAWELRTEEIDRVVGELASRELAGSTRRGYLQAFKGFHAFLGTRRAAEIEQLFGTHLEDPLDAFNLSRHVGVDSPDTMAPPSKERLDRFFEFLRERIAVARKFATAGRDYALFRTLYHAGLRTEEATLLEVRDLHFDRGPFGKVHVRFGKAAKTSGPRPRWVPMLDSLDMILRWYLQDVRPRFPGHDVLFCDESGGALATGTIRNRLTRLLQIEDGAQEEVFTPHDLRRACATVNYERGIDLVAIQQMLGHWHVGTTMRYVTPSATFIEDAYRQAVSKTLSGLEGPERAQ